MSTPGSNDQAYLQALDDVIASGDRLIQWLPEGEEKRSFALGKLKDSVDTLHPATVALQESADSDAQKFFTAAAEMRAGYLLVTGGKAAQTGQPQELKAALTDLRAEREELITGNLLTLKFESDLLEPPDAAVDDSHALATFKLRTGRTLDNMVTEAGEVIQGALDKFASKFNEFVNELGDLAKSFSSEGASGVIRSGVEWIVSGLKSLAEFLKSDKLQEGIDRLKELAGGGKESFLQRILAAAFACAGTKKKVEALVLSASRTRERIEDAGKHMAELAADYVGLLKNARWVLKAIGVVGGFLILTGVAAHYAALAVPIAYAVVALATVLIGMKFARSRVPELIESL